MTFARYTEEARRALFFARYEASQRGGLSIAGEHLLLGLIREGRGPVCAILAHFQVPPFILVLDIDERVPLEERVSPSVEIPFSREVQHALHGAREEAERLGHAHIGPEHLFLALLGEGQSVAAAALNQQGITLEASRDYIAKEPGPLASSTTEPIARRLEVIKLLVEQLNRADRSSPEAVELVSRIHHAIDALKPHLQ